MFCELSIPSASATQVETVDIKHVRHHFISQRVAAGYREGEGWARVAAGCREYNVEGRLELGTGNTQTHTKQGSSTVLDHAFTSKMALVYHFILLEFLKRRIKRAK